MGITKMPKLSLSASVKSIKSSWSSRFRSHQQQQPTTTSPDTGFKVLDKYSFEASSSESCPSIPSSPSTASADERRSALTSSSSATSNSSNGDWLSQCDEKTLARLTLHFDLNALGLLGLSFTEATEGLSDLTFSDSNNNDYEPQDWMILPQQQPKPQPPPRKEKSKKKVTFVYSYMLATELGSRKDTFYDDDDSEYERPTEEVEGKEKDTEAEQEQTTIITKTTKTSPSSSPSLSIDDQDLTEAGPWSIQDYVIDRRLEEAVDTALSQEAQSMTDGSVDFALYVRKGELAGLLAQVVERHKHNTVIGSYEGDERDYAIAGGSETSVSRLQFSLWERSMCGQ